MGLTRWQWATIVKPCHTHRSSPVQTPQLTAGDDITAASTLNTSCSLANIAARREALRYTEGLVSMLGHVQWAVDMCGL